MLEPFLYVDFLLKRPIGINEKKDMNKNTTIYEAFFGAYIGKMVSLSDDGYYLAGDYISGRYYTGTLESVRCKGNNLVLNLGSKEITVSDTTQIRIIE